MGAEPGFKVRTLLTELEEVGVVLGEVADELTIGLEVRGHAVDSLSESDRLFWPVAELLLEVVQEGGVELQDHLDVAEDALDLLLGQRGNVGSSLLKRMKKAVDQSMQT